MEKENKNLVVNKIEIKPLNRKPLDIGIYRNSTKSADTGRRTSLYNIYADAMLDNTLGDSIEKRITAITNAEITFTTKDGKTVDAIDTLIDTIEFETIIKEIISAKFWGISLMEFDFPDGQMKVYPIDRRHIRANIKEVALNENDDRGIPYDDDFFLEVGHKNDLGIILRAVPFVIYKRNGFGDWAQYVEVFGMPIRTAYYDGYDDRMRMEIAHAFEMAGAAAANILPKGCDFKIEPGAASGDGEVFNKLRVACNEEILIGILGQTMTTLDGSSLSQSKVHMAVEESKHKADRRYVQRTLNSKLLPLLAKRGYPVEGGYFYFPEAGETISLKDRITIDSQVSTLVPVAEQYFYDTYGVPRPATGERTVGVNAPARMEPESKPNNPDEDNENRKDGKITNRIRDFFAEASQGEAFGSTTHTAANDSVQEGLLKRVSEEHAKYFDAELFTDSSTALLNEFTRAYLAPASIVNIGMEYGVQNGAILTAYENNLFRFSAGKTIAQVQQLNEIFRVSKSFDEYATKALQLYDTYNLAYAKTEYITARMVGENTATYERQAGKINLFPYWQYLTVRDDQVRLEHQRLHGLILPADDPAWDEIYPPNGWRCRCRVKALMKGEVAGVNFADMRARVDEYRKTDEYKTAKKAGFGVNRGKSCFVFSENQQYVSLLDTNKTIAKLDGKSWGVGDIAELQRRAVGVPSKFEGTSEQWYVVHKVIATDSRTFEISEKSFKGMATGNRTALNYSISEALATPDEVWLFADSARGDIAVRSYMKHYQGVSIAVRVEVRGSRLEVVWWGYLTGRQGGEYRRGLLIKKR